MASESDSISEREGAADLRRAPRIALLLRAAKLVSRRGEFLCVLRDVSTSGAKARVFHALPADAYTLELGTGARYQVEPVWQDQGHAGFRFLAGPVELAALVDEAGPFPKRQLRLALTPPQALQIGLGGVRRAGQLTDISLHGARIETEPALALRQLVRLEAPALPVLHARVRWRRGTSHGLIFHHGFRLEALAELLGRLQLGDEADCGKTRESA